MAPRVLVAAVGGLLIAAIAALSLQVVRSSVVFLAWRAVTDVPLKKGFIDHGDVRIDFATYGAGPPLVLLHGGLSSSLDWIAEIPELAGKYQVIVIDLRGHGASTIGSEEFSYRLLASDVASVLDKLDIDRASIAGWSDGGNVGLLFALDFPSRIDRLVAVSANFHPEGIVQDVMQGILEAPEQTGSVVARWLYHLQSPSPERWPELQRRVTNMWQNYPTLSAEDLRDISVPTLLVVGEKDDIDREHSETMAKAIPNARLLVMPGVGHSIPRDAPEALVANMIRFLTDP